jgi:beta-phosphoglucomutase family hydrolase
MLKGFIFDMDGVIIDTEPLYLDNVRKILAELGIEITEKELHTYVGISSQKTWETIKQRHGLAQAVSWLVDYEQERIVKILQEADNLKPVTNIPDLIKFLQQHNFKIGLASSSPHKNINLILQKLQLTDCFEAIVNGEEVANGKPHPEIFLTCAARLGVKPAHCFVLEDSPYGVEGANSANMKTIGFVNLNSGNQDLTRADYLTTKIDDKLMNFIETAL